MPKAWVTVTAFNSDGYRKEIATLSEQQIHMHDTRIREPQLCECNGNVGVVIDPKEFPEMCHFMVSVELIK